MGASSDTGTLQNEHTEAKFHHLYKELNVVRHIYMDRVELMNPGLNRLVVHQIGGKPPLTRSFQLPSQGSRWGLEPVDLYGLIIASN